MSRSTSAPGDPNVYPSSYGWPEWAAFRDKYEIDEIRELGALGHSRREPTTLGTKGLSETL